MGRPFTRKTATERFIEKISPDPNTGCWDWVGSMYGSVTTHQYGQFQSGEDERTAHVWAYKRFIGAIPEGMKCCHKCDNTRCVNPYHLFLGSQKDNIRDARQKGRMPSWKERGGICPAILGALNGKRKLSVDKVSEIRRRFEAGETQTKLAKEFNVHQSSISVAVRGKTWDFGYAKKA